MKAIATAALVPVLIGLASAKAAAAPTVRAMFPASGQADVCVDTPLRLTFDGDVTLGPAGAIELTEAGTGRVVETIDVAATVNPNRAAGSRPTGDAASRRAAASAPATTRTGVRSQPIARKAIGNARFAYFPVRVEGNAVEIAFATTLEYGKSYAVRIDPGVFKTDRGDFPGTRDAAAWRFTVRAAPEKNNTRIVVATDPSGDFNTVQGAIDSVPDGNTTPTTIFIKSGVYTGLVNLANKHNLTFVGEDRKRTVLQFANNNNVNGGNRGVFNVRACRDLVLANLTVRNLTPLGGSQAETILIRNKNDARTIITGCDFYSTQDTVQVNGQAYLSDCYIEGTVDFIWGDGPCFFENCHVRALRTPGYYTQVRNRGDARGFVFYRCTFDGTEGVTRNVFARIRPSAYPESECVLIECKLGPAVSPRGFLFDGNEQDAKGTRFYEYASIDLNGKPVDVSQRAQSRQLKHPDDADLIRNYSDVTWVLGGWRSVVPKIVTTQK